MKVLADLNLTLNEGANVNEAKGSYQLTSYVLQGLQFPSHVLRQVIKFCCFRKHYIESANIHVIFSTK